MARWLRIVSLSLLVTFPSLVTAQNDARPAPSSISPGPLVFESPEPPPAKSGPVLWKHRDLSVSGRWYTDAQVEAIAKRMWMLEDLATKEKVSTARTQAEADVAKAGLGIPRWVWITAGLVVGAGIGVGVGWYTWKRNEADNAVGTATGGPLIPGLTGGF